MTCIEWFLEVSAQAYSSGHANRGSCLGTALYLSEHSGLGFDRTLDLRMEIFRHFR